MLDKNSGKSMCTLRFDLHLQFLLNKCLLLKIVTFGLGCDFEKGQWWNFLNFVCLISLCLEMVYITKELPLSSCEFVNIELLLSFNDNSKKLS